MSKKLILCVVLALSLILVGTGYAYWTDTLNVTTKATTGDLDVTFVDLGAYAQYANEHGNGDETWWSIIDGIERDENDANLFDGYVGAKFFQRGDDNHNDVFGTRDKRDDYYDNAEDFNSVSMDAKLLAPGTELGKTYPDYPYLATDFHGDTISITLNELYPGYAQAFRSDILNIGSIAAKLSQVEFEVSDGGFGNTDETNALIGVALLVQDENPSTYKEIVKLANNFNDPDNFFTLGGVKFVRLSALEKLDKVTIGENFILVPGKTTEGDKREHRADLFIGIAVDPDAAGKYTTGSVAKMNDENSDSKTQNKGVQLDITFGWDQFNEGVNPEAENILKLQN